MNSVVKSTYKGSFQPVFKAASGSLLNEEDLQKGIYLKDILETLYVYFTSPEFSYAKYEWSQDVSHK